MFALHIHCYLVTTNQHRSTIALINFKIIILTIYTLLKVRITSTTESQGNNISYFQRQLLRNIEYFDCSNMGEINPFNIYICRWENCKTESIINVHVNMLRVPIDSFKVAYYSVFSNSYSKKI